MSRSESPTAKMSDAKSAIANAWLLTVTMRVIHWDAPTS